MTYVENSSMAICALNTAICYIINRPAVISINLKPSNEPYRVWEQHCDPALFLVLAGKRVCEEMNNGNIYNRVTHGAGLGGSFGSFPSTRDYTWASFIISLFPRGPSIY